MDDDLMLQDASDQDSQFTGPPDICISESARRAIWEHAESDTSREVGGVLVGRVVAGPDGTTVKIDKAWSAEHTEASSVHVKFTHRTWEQWHSLLDEEPEGTRIVGWYHSHPGLGIFLSDHDLFIHEHFFDQPWQVAFVLDPHSGESGWFGWRNGHVQRLPDGAVYMKPAQIERTRSGLARRPQPGQAAAQPPAGQASSRDASPAPRPLSFAARFWWLGWGVALAMFIIAALEASGMVGQRGVRAALDRLSMIRGDIIEIRQRLAEVAKKPGRWYTLRPDETLAEVCRRTYGDPSLADAIAAINGLSAPPAPGTQVWLPAAEALKPSEPPPAGGKPAPAGHGGEASPPPEADTSPGPASGP